MIRLIAAFKLPSPKRTVHTKRARFARRRTRRLSYHSVMGRIHDGYRADVRPRVVVSWKTKLRLGKLAWIVHDHGRALRDKIERLSVADSLALKVKKCEKSSRLYI